MSKVQVTTTIEVLGKKLTRKEAEALYHELQRELKMTPPTTTIPVPYPVDRTPIRWPYDQTFYGTTSNDLKLVSTN